MPAASSSDEVNSSKDFDESSNEYVQKPVKFQEASIIIDKQESFEKLELSNKLVQNTLAKAVEIVSSDELKVQSDDLILEEANFDSENSHL